MTDDTAETPMDAPKAKKKPRRLSVTDKLMELRQQNAAALEKLMERESKLRAELGDLIRRRKAAQDALTRLDATLPQPEAPHDGAISGAASAIANIRQHVLPNGHDTQAE